MSSEKKRTLSSFDAFPKLDASYKTFTPAGTGFTFITAFFLFYLTLSEYRASMAVTERYDFDLDQNVTADMSLNLDVTINMECNDIHVSILEGSQSSVTLDTSFKFQRVKYDFEKAANHGKPNEMAKKLVQQIGHDEDDDGFGWAEEEDDFWHNANIFKPLMHYFGSDNAKPYPVLDKNGKQCRIRGTRKMNKVKSEIKIVPRGFLIPGLGLPASHLNMTHVIHNLQFGAAYPGRQDPLNHVIGVGEERNHSFKYILKVVPTTYRERYGKAHESWQYAMTGRRRILGAIYPMILIKYEPSILAIRIDEKADGFIHFLYRTLGMTCGLVVIMGSMYSLISRLVAFLNPTPSPASSRFSSRASSMHSRYSSATPSRSNSMRVDTAGQIGRYGSRRTSRPVHGYGSSGYASVSAGSASEGSPTVGPYPTNPYR